MKEIKDILNAYKAAVQEGKKTALATVVKVEGSSYRRPGARMLITDDGHLTGAISGGCLEGDALRKALSAIVQQENKLITYDTTDDDDVSFGVQLGCNGIVHILFEPIKINEHNNPIHLLEKLENNREQGILVTLFSLNHSEQTGTSLLYQKGKLYSKIESSLKENILKDVSASLENKSSTFKCYPEAGYDIEAFIEFIPPPIQLVIAGAGNDVLPLVKISAVLGWEIIIADGRQSHANIQRFPKADKILVIKPEKLLSQISVDEHTAFVLMTHNYNYDLALLDDLLKIDVPYIGVLGPKKKLNRMLDELRIDSEEKISHVHGPVGLDIGAETAEEIAIAIIAEIKAIFTNSTGAALKEKTSPIHY